MTNSFSTNDILEPEWSTFIPDEREQLAASDLWHQVIAEMRQRGTLAPANSTMIRRYVLAIIIYDRAAANVLQGGPVLTARKTKVLTHNPYWTVMRDANEMASRCEQELGISPRRRNIPTVKKGKTSTNADKFLID